MNADGARLGKGHLLSRMRPSVMFASWSSLLSWIARIVARGALLSAMSWISLSASLISTLRQSLTKASQVVSGLAGAGVAVGWAVCALSETGDVVIKAPAMIKLNELRILSPECFNSAIESRGEVAHRIKSEVMKNVCVKR